MTMVPSPFDGTPRPRLGLLGVQQHAVEYAVAPSSPPAHTPATVLGMSRSDSAVHLVRTGALTDTAPYAYAATTDAGARLVFAAGACPLDDTGATVAPGDIAAQARQCVANLLTALDAAGARIEDVAYTRVLVATTVREDLVTAWTVVHDAFGEHEVPSTLHGVTVLGYPDQLVEIEAVAALR